MNGDSLSLVAPRFIVGPWDRLTAQQQRIFITYVRANFGGEAGADPAAFATRLWNDSVSIANSGGTPGSDRLLNLSRLTTFVGVTSMWEKRNVIDQVTVVTNINGDQPSGNFRLFGELAPTGGERVKKEFDHSIAGSGHNDFSVSRREQGLLGQPNGQFSMTKDLLRFDSDVDYRRLLNPAHNTKDNSDIRAFDGSKSHLQRHIGRYGGVPLTMQDVLLGPPSATDLFVAADIATDAAPEMATVHQARAVTDAFIARFNTTLTLDGLFEEMFAPGAIQYIKSTGLFDALGLSEELVNSLSEAELVRVFKRLMDFYYLHNLYEMRTEFLGVITLGERTQEQPAEIEAALGSVPQLRALVNEDASEDLAVDTAAELDELLAAFERAASAYRERLRAGEGRAELFRANVRSINSQKENPYRVETLDAEVADGAPRNIYTVEQGVFTVQLVQAGADMKIIGLGIG
ncbi:MAG TPA: hypothetical protein VIW80_20730 [Pyrinomonadaceae bacterium]|jgi:hypothetical protein